MYHINMTRTLTITKAREELPTLVDRASKRMDDYIITVNGVPQAVIMSVAEYESWQETNEIMNDPKLMRDIRQGEKEIEEGKGIPWEDVKKELGLK